MKKLLAVTLTIALLPLCGGCTDNSNAYVTPEENCIVSLPEDFSLRSKSQIEKIDTSIKGIKREDNRVYYSVEKSAECNIICEEDRINYNDDTYTEGNALIGYKTSDNEMIFADIFKNNSGTYSFTCDTDIEPVYDSFEMLGIIMITTSNDSLYDTTIRANNFFNDDGTIKPMDGVYYLIEYTHPTEENLADLKNNSYKYWNTNLKPSDIVIDNTHITCTIDKFSLGENQSLMTYRVNRTTEGIYFITDTVQYDNAFINILESSTYDMPDGAKLTIKFI